MERGKQLRKWLWISWDLESMNRPRFVYEWYDEDVLGLSFSVSTGSTDPVFLIEAQFRLPARLAKLLP